MTESSDLSQTPQWVAYCLGALLSLTFKYGRYLYFDQVEGADRTWKEVTLEWLFHTSPENKVSWATTIGVVWVGGALLIEGGQGLVLEWFPISATHASLAFLSGALMEMIAPELAKEAARRFAPRFLRDD